MQGGKKGVGPDMFFLQALLVSPNRFRPFNEIGGTQTEHEHNVLYVRILKACLDINDLKSRRCAPASLLLELEWIRVLCVAQICICVSISVY